MEWTYNLTQIHLIANELLKYSSGKNIIAFHGEMGAGKTTFIAALCAALHVEDSISSPTFPLINEYSYDCDGTARVLFHLDLYRLSGEEEAIRAGVEDVLLSGYRCFVEWPEKAPSILPNDTVHVQIELIDEENRRLKIADK